MRSKWHLFLLASLVCLLVTLVVGCTEPKVTPTSTPSLDIPQLSSRDVIILVIEYTERQLGITTTQPKSSRKISGDWDCVYAGNGTWFVYLRIPGEGRYEWVVYENNKSVQSLGMKH